MILLTGCSEESSDSPELVVPPVDTNQNNGCISIDTDQDGVKDCQDNDIDNDGFENCLDFPLDLSLDVACNQDAFPYDRLEWEDNDNDGIGNNSDWAINDPTEQFDRDEDLIGDNADPDDDNDGVPDIFDQFSNTPNIAFDIDGDTFAVNLYEGHPTISAEVNEDPDRDNDGVPDVFDDLFWSFNGQFDIDGDLLGAGFDSDLDGDGVINDEDRFPYNAEEAFDFDRDSIGDNADPDDDNDGYPDILDDYPFNKTRFYDSDGDGFANLDDWAPFNPLEWEDNDNDGFGDNIEDIFPFDGTEWADSDRDGIGDNSDPDIDGDGFTNEIDAFPFDPDDHSDRDGDLLGDSVDPDDDNDGYPNVFDEFPFNRRQYIDFDNDGIEDFRLPTIPYDTIYDSYEIAQLVNSEEWIAPGTTAYKIDPDSDNDGIPDYFDDLPWNPLDWADIDEDGIGSISDLDDDGDGVADEFDVFPYDSTESRDQDDDGLGDNEDFDDDNDGFPDVFDQVPFNRNGGFDIEGTFEGRENDLIPNGSAERFDLVPEGQKIKLSDADYDGDTFRQADIVCRPAGTDIPYFEQVMTDTTFSSLSDPDAWTVISGTRNGLAVVSDNTGAVAEQKVLVEKNIEYFIYIDVSKRSPLGTQSDNSRVIITEANGNVILDRTGGFNSNNGILVGPTLDGEITVNVQANFTDTNGVQTGSINDVSLFKTTSQTANNHIICEFSGQSFDVFPFDGLEWADNDEDTIGNNADPDDDNDGVPDVFDSFPLDIASYVISSPRFADLDFDGTPNSEDTDIDGDGAANEIDVFPYDPAEQSDSDNDTLGNTIDPDDDNDGIPDVFDDLPFDPNFWRDRDGDGVADSEDIYTPNGIRDENDMKNGILAGEDIFIETDILEITECIDVIKDPSLPIPDNEIEILISSTNSSEIFYTGPSDSCVFNAKKLGYLGFEGLQVILDTDVTNTVFLKATEFPSEVGFLQFINTIFFVNNNNRLLEANVAEGVNLQSNTVFVVSDTNLTGNNTKIISFDDGGATADNQGALSMYSNILFWSIETDQTNNISFVHTPNPIKSIDAVLNVLYFKRSKVNSVNVGTNNFFDIKFDQNLTNVAHRINFVKNRIRKDDNLGKIFNIVPNNGALDENLINSRQNYMNSNDFTLGDTKLDKYTAINVDSGLNEERKSLFFYANRFDEEEIWLDFEGGVYLPPYYPFETQVLQSPALHLPNPDEESITFCEAVNNETSCILAANRGCRWESSDSTCNFQGAASPEEICARNIFVAEDLDGGISEVNGEVACNDDVDNFCSWDTSQNSSLLLECQVNQNEEDCNNDTSHFCFWDPDQNSCTVKGRCLYNEPNFVNICLSYNFENDPELSCNNDTRHTCLWLEAEHENEITGCQYAPALSENPGFVDVQTELSNQQIAGFEVEPFPVVYYIGARAPILDTDGDFFPDDEDEFPLDPTENSDNDKDGTGDNADLDDDNDGLTDEDEINIHNTDPLLADTDGDGDTDGFEILNGTDPLDPFSARDTDEDGLSDNFELTFFTACVDPHLKKDSDGDGLEDREEYEIQRTDPCLADTDGDGLNDFEEINTYNTFPKIVDSDGDRVPDGQEVIDGTSPLNSGDFLDTDGDGIPNAIDSSPFGANDTASFNSQLLEAMECYTKLSEGVCTGTPLKMCNWDFDDLKCRSNTVTITNDITINRCYEGNGIKIKTSPNVSRKKIIIPSTISASCNFNERGVFDFKQIDPENLNTIENVDFLLTNIDGLFSLDDAVVSIVGSTIIVNDDSFDGAGIFKTKDDLSEITMERSTVRLNANYQIPIYTNLVLNPNFNSNINSWDNNFTEGFIDWFSGQLRLYPFDRVNPLENFIEFDNNTSGWSENQTGTALFSTLLPSNCGGSENCYRVFAPQDGGNDEEEPNEIEIERTVPTVPGRKYSIYYNASTNSGKIFFLQSNDANIFTFQDNATVDQPTVKTNNLPIYFTATGNNIKIKMVATEYEDGLGSVEYDGVAQLNELFIVEDQICRGLSESSCNNALSCNYDNSLNECVAYTPATMPNAPDPIPVEKVQQFNVLAYKFYDISFDIETTDGLLEARLGSSAYASDYGIINVSGNNINSFNQRIFSTDEDLFLTLIYDRQGNDNLVYGFLDNVSITRVPDIPEIKPIFETKEISKLSLRSTIVECDYKGLYGNFDCLNLSGNDISISQSLLVGNNRTDRMGEESYVLKTNHLSGDLIIDETRIIHNSGDTAFLDSMGNVDLSNLRLRNKDGNNTLFREYLGSNYTGSLLTDFNLDNLFTSASSWKLSCVTDDTLDGDFSDVHPAYFEFDTLPRSFMNLVERTQGQGDTVEYIGGDNTLCR